MILEKIKEIQDKLTNEYYLPIELGEIITVFGDSFQMKLKVLDMQTSQDNNLQYTMRIVSSLFDDERLQLKIDYQTSRVKLISKSGEALIKYMKRGAPENIYLDLVRGC